MNALRISRSCAVGALSLGVASTMTLALAGCGDDDGGNGPAAAMGTGGAVGSSGGSQGNSGGAVGSSGGAQGSSGGSQGNSGGALSAAGGGSSGGAQGTGGAAPTTPSVTGPAVTAADGTLSNLPGVAFARTSGNLVITTMYARLEVLSSFTSVQFWGDVENRGTDLECIPLATLAIDGYDVLTVVDAPAYDGSSTVSSSCIAPGGTGAFSGIDNDASATLLDDPASIAYSFDTFPGASFVPHPGAPTLVSPVIENTSGLYRVSGSVRAGSTAIYNLGIDFYIRDSSGLLRDRKGAYPGDLGDILPAQVLPFSTNGDADPFESYEHFSSFIEGSENSAFAVETPDAESAAFASRKRLLKERFERVREERGQAPSSGLASKRALPVLAR